MRVQIVCMMIIFASFSALADDDGGAGQDLLGRTHNLRFGMGFSTATAGDVDTTNINVDVMYRHNFGYIEPGLGLSYASSNSDPGYPGEKVSYDFLVRGNFKKNEPGNNFIPYVQAGVTIVANEDEDATSYRTYSGSPFNFGVGIQIYPFSEIFAFDIALMHSAGSFESTSDSPESSSEADSSTTALRIGYTLSFE